MAETGSPIHSPMDSDPPLSKAENRISVVVANALAHNIIRKNKLEGFLKGLKFNLFFLFQSSNTVFLSL